MNPLDKLPRVNILPCWFLFVAEHFFSFSEVAVKLLEVCSKHMHIYISMILDTLYKEAIKKLNSGKNIVERIQRAPSILRWSLTTKKKKKSSSYLTFPSPGSFDHFQINPWIILQLHLFIYHGCTYADKIVCVKSQMWRWQFNFFLSHSLTLWYSIWGNKTNHKTKQK